MKKILLFCAAMVAAMSLNAQIVMTPDSAYDAAKALNAGDTLTVDGTVVIVEVTAYVTNGGNGTITSGWQTFYVGKTANETAKTLQAYKCTMPANETTGVNKGDKVKITGKLMHYVNASGTTDVAEFINASAEIVERVVVKTDTIDDLSVCEIIEEGESLNAKEYSSDFFEVVATVDSLTYTNANKFQQTFFLFCDNGKRLQAYNANMQDSVLAAEGDTVKLFGKIMHYVDATKDLVEFEGAKAWVVGKNQVVVEIDTIEATVAKAIEVGKALADNAHTSDVYAVTGYVDSIAYAYKEDKGTMSFFMTDNMDSLAFDFEAYSVNVTAAQAPLVKVGAKVKVIGFLQHYVKAAVINEEDPSKNKPAVDLIEIMSGAELVIIEEAPEQGIENVVLTEKAQKVMVDGVLYIIRDNKMYNVQGALVR